MVFQVEKADFSRCGPQLSRDFLLASRKVFQRNLDDWATHDHSVSRFDASQHRVMRKYTYSNACTSVSLTQRWQSIRLDGHSRYAERRVCARCDLCCELRGPFLRKLAIVMSNSAGHVSMIQP